jgi:hypothetical protein
MDYSPGGETSWWPAGTEAFGIQIKAADNLILTQRLYRCH